VKVVGDRMRRNPGQAYRKLAGDFNVSKSAIANLVKNKLGHRPFKRRTAQLLTPAQKKKRAKRCKELLTRLANGRHREVIFFDEKQFGQEQPYTPQNDRVYARRFEEKFATNSPRLLSGETSHWNRLLLYEEISAFFSKKKKRWMGNC
jgi:hypothetical protein